MSASIANMAIGGATRPSTNTVEDAPITKVTGGLIPRLGIDIAGLRDDQVVLSQSERISQLQNDGDSVSAMAVVLPMSVAALLSALSLQTKNDLPSTIAYIA